MMRRTQGDEVRLQRRSGGTTVRRKEAASDVPTSGCAASTAARARLQGLRRAEGPARALPRETGRSRKIPELPESGPSPPAPPS